MQVELANADQTFRSQVFQFDSASKLGELELAHKQFGLQTSQFDLDKIIAATNYATAAHEADDSKSWDTYLQEGLAKFSSKGSSPVVPNEAKPGYQMNTGGMRQSLNNGSW